MSKAPQQWAWIVTCVLLAVAGLVKNARAEDEEYYELMRVFVDTFEQIDRNYVKDVDRRQLVEAAVRGMLSELDPYSNYISPDDITRFNEEIEQEFGGIGIQVTFQPDKGGLLVSSPLPGSPAYKAGVLAGDVIVEIEGEAVADFPNARNADRRQHAQGKTGRRGDDRRAASRQRRGRHDPDHPRDHSAQHGAGRHLQSRRFLELTCTTTRPRSATSG